MGLIVIRSKGIYVEPQRTLERIAEAMTASGAKGVPKKLQGEWRRYYPGRTA